jgi:hypothetical protein
MKRPLVYQGQHHFTRTARREPLFIKDLSTTPRPLSCSVGLTRLSPEELTMETKNATCSCGQVRLQVSGEPVAVSVCHCLDCQKRTGSAFGAQARYLSEQVECQGETRAFERQGDTGSSVTFHFCGKCGTTMYWNPEKLPGQTTVALGAFADPEFTKTLSYTVYETRRHPWLGKLDAKERYD